VRLISKEQIYIGTRAWPSGHC